MLNVLKIVRGQVQLDSKLKQREVEEEAKLYPGSPTDPLTDPNRPVSKKSLTLHPNDASLSNSSNVPS